MKVLSLPEPWAFMVCAGIMDVICLPWKPDEVPGRILIQASSKRATFNTINKFPLELQGVIYNHMFMGNMCNISNLPRKAIIGYVTITGVGQKTSSVWDRDPNLISWKVTDSWVFRKPIRNVNGRRGLFEYNLDEYNLPEACKLRLDEIHIEKGKYVLPIGDGMIDGIESKRIKKWEYYDSCGMIDVLLSDYKPHNPKPLRTVVLKDNFRSVEFELVGAPSFKDWYDDFGNPVYFANKAHMIKPLRTIRFEFGKKLKEVFHHQPEEWIWQPSTLVN